MIPCHTKSGNKFPPAQLSNSSNGLARQPPQPSPSSPPNSHIPTIEKWLSSDSANGPHPQIVKPLWPFMVSGGIVLYLVARMQDQAIRSPQWRNDPRNPYAAQLAKESLH
ncbi:putative ATP synthase j chain [Lyophyllum shimeji]|uniref:ATP synthase j chain n=1 Tax=Lyophyllum shimeji TaxID=47721 RepID=A0A9P3UKI5_LYOSH|nr:putative ATP synthase j chain [Lyophyllum shimeji]